MADKSNQDVLGIETEAGKGYALSGKIMLSAIVILFSVVVFMVGLHLYARWYLIRLRRRQVERRLRRRVSRTQIVLYAADSGVADRGLEPTVLNSLPLFLYAPAAEKTVDSQPQLECAVCLSEFEEKEIVRLLPKCNHSFHIECIDMWFRSHSTCPLCRSPVERVVSRGEPVAKPVGEPEGVVSEPGSSSAAEACAACQHEGGGTTSFGGRRKGAELLGVRIEVPPRRAELESELTQSSPASRLLAFARILSMGRRSPVSGGGRAMTPRGGDGVDLESGIGELDGEPSRVQTRV